MGEFVQMDESEYNSDNSRVRSSSMKLFFSPQGPRRYYMERIAGRIGEHDPNDEFQPRIDKFVLGRILHEYVLEGKQNFFLCDSRRGTNAWKDEIEENDGLWALNKSDFNAIIGMREGLMRNPEIRRVIERERWTEDTILWDKNGIPAKARLDAMAMAGALEIDDLKSTAKTDREGFRRQLEDLMYPFSAAFYVQALRSVDGFAGVVPRFFHIVVHKKPPFWAYRWELDPGYIKHAMDQVDKAFEMLSVALERQERGDDWQTAWPDREEQRQGDRNPPSDYYLERTGVNPLDYDPFE